MKKTGPTDPTSNGKRSLKSLFEGRKRVVALTTAAVAAVALTGVGAIATSQTAITNNQFIKDAATAGFTFTGTAFDAHFNTTTNTARETWTAANASTTESATFDGIFAMTNADKPLPKEVGEHLKIAYALSTGVLPPITGDGGTIANPIALAKALKKEAGITLGSGKSDTVTVTVTWDGTDPAPAQAIDAIADFNVTYSMNPNK
ncbi:hypothetical protein O159_03250 [Leifsonia xyli subsp. cynodontis DSM 46306]|uniref:Uncharacterized protein n=1 Tax=Leifsonia xyli subsp. cynodontis DSM 46306 TaxID=1389489 RepID=U3P468_LEIXC|nr:hypothetical protein [Leifsonia xyli]AGW40546.1 hypothetical protein O159_03250 [Leifsonia xyli subsp. cynodontis DSM 46306]